MSYTALYRKYRPQTFKDILGQDHIVKTLQNQIQSGRISHAYLFCGTRGTGKTSTAKIFARAVNCHALIDFDLCGECESCKNQSEGINMNVIEIDAASNNGVDNIRELREEVKYPPTSGKYKIYIIDEVHMLSTGAFNALLKTLEEPPAHIIFILATTDPQKIPTTIHSRCQRFDFKRITASSITNRLEHYMEQEQIEAQQKALNYIAKLSDGSMRDALSILDQCVSFYYGEKITLEKVLEITGSVDDSILYQITSALNEMDTKKALDIIEHIMMQGRDTTQFINEIIQHLRNLLILKVTVNVSNVLDISEESIEKLKSQSKTMPQEKITHYIHVFSELMNQIKYATNPRILLEVTIIKITHPANEHSYQGILERITRLEKDISTGTIKPAIQTPEKKEQIKQAPQKKIPAAIPDDIKKVIDNWNEIKISFKLGAAIDSLLSETTSAGYLDDEILYIICDYYVSRETIEKNIDVIAEHLNKKYNKQFKIKTIEKEEYEYKTKKSQGNLEETPTDNRFERYKNILPDLKIY